LGDGVSSVALTSMIYGLEMLRTTLVWLPILLTLIGS
jgi:hypothetical protein